MNNGDAVKRVEEIVKQMESLTGELKELKELLRSLGPVDDRFRGQLSVIPLPLGSPSFTRRGPSEPPFEKVEALASRVILNLKLIDLLFDLVELYKKPSSKYAGSAIKSVGHVIALGGRVATAASQVTAIPANFRDSITLILMGQTIESWGGECIRPLLGEAKTRNISSIHEKMTSPSCQAVLRETGMALSESALYYGLSKYNAFNFRSYLVGALTKLLTPLTPFLGVAFKENPHQYFHRTVSVIRFSYLGAVLLFSVYNLYGILWGESDLEDGFTVTGPEADEPLQNNITDDSSNNQSVCVPPLGGKLAIADNIDPRGGVPGVEATIEPVEQVEIPNEALTDTIQTTTESDVHKDQATSDPLEVPEVAATAEPVEVEQTEKTIYTEDSIFLPSDGQQSDSVLSEPQLNPQPTPEEPPLSLVKQPNVGLKKCAMIDLMRAITSEKRLLVCQAEPSEEKQNVLDELSTKAQAMPGLSWDDSVYNRLCDSEEWSQAHTSDLRHDSGVCAEWGNE